MKERLRPTMSRRTKRNLPVYMTKSFEQRREKAGAGIMLGNGAKRLVLTAVFAGIPWSRVRVEAVNSAPPQPHQTNFTTSTTMGFAVGTVELSMKELPFGFSQAPNKHKARGPDRDVHRRQEAVTQLDQASFDATH